MQQQRTCPVPANSADLFFLLVFSQGLQGSAEGWEEEGNLVSETNHLLYLFITLFTLFLEQTLVYLLSFLSLSLFSSLPDGFSPQCWFEAMTRQSLCWMTGPQSVPRSLSPPVAIANCGHVVVLTLPRCKLCSLSGSSCTRED